ncbi:MAG: hypothetical protein IJ485_05245, partial [Lachnospiraceae bacterium]|nr:hypothetical protein [Lachnospiraceae bacterium]
MMVSITTVSQNLPYKNSSICTGATFNRFVRFLNEAQRHQVLPETPRGEASFVKGRTIEDVE